MSDVMHEVDLDAVERRLGHRFRDRSVLERALTHRSFANETWRSADRNYERLEFLGDAVLDLVVAETLMRELPDADEGRLTRARAALVNEGSLAEVARQLELGRALRLGHGEEQNNGRAKPSILADAVEAVIGAVYLDAGYAAARNAARAWLGSRFDDACRDELPGDPKTALQERLQADAGAAPHYAVVETSGPDHEKEFVVQISSGEQVLAEGRGRSKKEAEKDAARRALKREPAEE